MRLGLMASSLIALSALALPAAAQDASEKTVVTVDAPSLSETNSARSDWYRQFAQSKPAEARPVWQAEPTEDFSVKFGTDTRWQLSLDKLSRPGASPLPREEMQAGATFRITPRFSVGGEVSVGADNLNDTSQWDNREIETGIRLKSAFKF